MTGTDPTAGTAARRSSRAAPTEAVLRLVDVCARRAALAHRGRALCGAAGAALAVLALTVLDGHPLDHAHGLFLAALVGALTFAAWTRSARFGEDEVARTLHRAFPSAGFLASFERARSELRSPLAELGAYRAYRAVPVAGARAATCPAAVPFIALPVLGVFGLALAVEVRDERASADFGAATVEALARGMAAVGGEHAGGLDDAGREGLGALSDEVAAAESGSVTSEEARRWADELEGMALGQSGAVRDDLLALALTAELLAPAAVDDVSGSPASPEALEPQSQPAELQPGELQPAGAAQGGERGGASSEGDGATDPAGPRGTGDGDAPGVDGGVPNGGGQGFGPAPATPLAARGPGGRLDPADAAQEGGNTPARAGLPPVAIPARHAPVVRAWLARRV